MGLLRTLALLGCWASSSCTLLFTEPKSCAEIFPGDEGKTHYRVCPDIENVWDVDVCLVSANLYNMFSCNDFCQDYGMTCVDALNTSGGDDSCVVNEVENSCDGVHFSEVCVCERN